MARMRNLLRPGMPYRRRATAATELCITLPLLVTLAVGGVDLGRAIYTSIALSNAARTGVEYAATHKFTSFTRPFWETQVRQAVIDEMQPISGFDPQRLTVIITTLSESSGLFIATVEAHYPFETIVNWVAVPHSVDLKRAVTMRQIR